MFRRARQLCLALPETAERLAWGHPNFRAGQKVFCAFEMIKGRPSIAFKVSPTQARRSLRGRAFFETPYGRGRWVSVWVDEAVDWDAIAWLVEQSYRGIAIKRMLAALDARSQ
ncbi:MAG TPA: MmcQ/YjbR family DNA-binding protein [Vicinamibacterales bacterium]|nr:MmcQ/YjbR family DNA-binding protein [Vicinamibacterales bacterium]